MQSTCKLHHHYPNEKCIEITNKEDEQDVNQSISDIKNEIRTQNPDSGIIRRPLKVLKSIPSIVANNGLEICIGEILDNLSTYI